MRIIMEADDWQDKLIQCAAAVSDAQIDEIITKHAMEAIEEAIASEIQIFFIAGEGRKAIARAVIKRLRLQCDGEII